MPSKKSITLFVQFFFFAGLSVFGQSHSIQGIVLDEESNPIPYSSVVVKDDSTKVLLGTISDLTGSFVLNLPSLYDNDTLKISSVGYQTLLITIRQIREQVKTQFHLHQSITTLPTVVFRGLTARQLIEECVKEIPGNYRNVSFSNRAYYWSATKEDSAYRALKEGVVSVSEHHSLQTSKRSFSYDSVIQAGSSLEEFISFDNMENLFYFDFIRTGSGITNLDNLNEWRFEYLNINSEQYSHSTVVKASRHDKVGHFIIYINPVDYSFERVEFSYRWPSNLHPFDRSKLYKLDYVEGVVQYHKTDKKYGIKYLFCSFGYSVVEQYTFKKILSRNTDFEFTLLSSLELNYGTVSRRKHGHSKNERVVVNSARYCAAALALAEYSEQCE